MLLSSFIIERNVTDELRSKLQQRYSQRWDKKNSIQNISSINLGLQSIRIPVCVHSIGILGGKHLQSC